jgi:hypothetical protein
MVSSFSATCLVTGVQGREQLSAAIPFDEPASGGPSPARL